MEKKNIPKKYSNGKRDLRLRKEALRTIKKKQIINLGLALILIFVLFAGALLIYLNTVQINIDNKTPDFIKKIVELNERFIQKKIGPAAVVNGEEITIKELDDRYNLLPDDYKSLITKEEVLFQMIEEKILLMQAAKLNISTTPEEVNERINTLLDENQVTEQQFEEVITSRNLTMDDVKGFYSKEILLTKLLNEEIISGITITDKDIQNYYKNNVDLFKIPASINVSHILICHNESLRCTSNLTKEEALSLAENIKNMVNSSNFALLALEYSNEPAAVITEGNLGWVSTDSPFDTTFMDAAFNLDSGVVSEPVETVFGYHIIKVFDRKNESALELDAVYNQVNQTIKSERESDAFNVYLSQLKNESQIINFLEKN